MKAVKVTDGDALTRRFLKARPLTGFFDSIEVDVEPSAFRDYNELKRALAARERGPRGSSTSQHLSTPAGHGS